MTGKTKIREDGSICVMVRHRRQARANPESDAPVIGLTFSSPKHLATFLRTFEPPEDDCYFDLRNLDLSGQDLTGAKLPHVHLQGTDLTGTILRDAHMPYACLRGSVMDKTDLTGADVSKARVDGQVFGGKVISASDTFNDVVNKPTRSEKKAMKRALKAASLKP